MATQTNLLSPSRIRPDIKNFLEAHVLGGLSLRAACQEAGLPYHKNVSQHKFTKVGQAFVEQLRRRRRVIEEFGADIPSLARLIEIRDMALKSNSFVAAVRASELCIRVASKANSDKKQTGDEKEISEMSREELLAEISQITLKAGGEVIENEDDEIEETYKELMGQLSKSR